MFDKISMFGDRWFDKNTYSEGLLALNQLIDLSTNSQTTISPIPPIPPYQRYKGLSSMGQMIVWIIKHRGAGYREDIPDTKHSIYKHYISKHHMFDMADIKV